MCGIFGAFGAYPQDLPQTLMRLNMPRGNRGMGMVILGDDAIQVNRIPAGQPLPQPAGDFLGHTVAPTGKVHHLHPFETDRFLLAHNGILLNHHDFPGWSLGVDVDSAYLLGGIQQAVSDDMDIAQAIGDTAGRLDGQMACWLVDRFTHVVYFWRVMAPLYWGQGPGYAYFSSVRVYEDDLFPNPGIVFQRDGFCLRQVNAFPFYSPYGV